MSSHNRFFRVLGGMNWFLVMAILLFLAPVGAWSQELGSWTTTGAMVTMHQAHSATLLQNGKVLVATGDSRGSTELYDPSALSWSATGSLAVGRYAHSATLLPDGKVLVAGGWDGSNYASSLDSAELYDPTAGTWNATGSLATARFD